MSIEDQIKNILGYKNNEIDEEVMGPGKIETTLTNEEEDKIQEIKRHISELNIKLKNKFNFIYGQKRPNIENKEDQEEFDTLVKEIEKSKEGIEKRMIADVESN